MAVKSRSFDDFANFLHILFCTTCGGTFLNAASLNRSFPVFELRKPVKNLFSPHGIVTETCFEHFVHL